MALPTELVSPLTVIDELFQRSVSGGSVPEAWGEREHFVQALGLRDEEAFARIPCINDVDLADSIRPFCLVRYRGLVQDVFEPEYYTAVFRECDAGPAGSVPGSPERILTTKYREYVEPAPGRELHEYGRNGFKQRGARYCVPLPGESEWARKSAAKWLSAEPLGALQGGAGAAAPAVQHAASTASKRLREEDVEMTGCEADTARRAPSLRATSSPQQEKPSMKISSTADEFGLNFPLPEEEKRGRGMSMGCIVKLYDQEEESLKLCDTVEILGVLCINPEIANLEAPMEDDIFGTDARHPSTALVPRLHAILVRKIPFYHPLFPFTPDWLSEARLVAAFQRTLGGPTALAAARDAAITQLAQYLGVDMLAAEYVLMLLVSRSFGKDGDKLLGCWSLNMVNWPQDMDVKKFKAAAAELVPRAVHLELNATALNNKAWRPRKDYAANRLVAAQLQLAPGTLLVLDETQMAEGKLSQEGVKNLTAVGALLTDQQLVCDFTSYDCNFLLELSTIIVSRGRSIVKGVDAVLPLERKVARMGEAPTNLEHGPLDAARMLIGLVTRRPKAIRMAAGVEQRFIEDFTTMRGQLQVPPELCNLWMSLARAQCLTHGDDELTMERWQVVANMEKERLRRCAVAGMLRA